MGYTEFVAAMKERLKEEDFCFENDKEYAFGVGQIVRTLAVADRDAPFKKQNVINPYLNAKDDAEIKERLRDYYKKSIDNLKTLEWKMMAAAMGYTPTNFPPSEDYMLAGFTREDILEPVHRKQVEWII